MENIDLKLDELMPGLDALLKLFDKDVSLIKEVYVGDTHGCRCGCLGNYHEPKSRGFKLALTRIRKIMNENKFIKWKEIDYTDSDCYIDIPYITNSGNERSVCIYFN